MGHILITDWQSSRRSCKLICNRKWLAANWKSHHFITIIIIVLNVPKSIHMIGTAYVYCVLSVMLNVYTSTIDIHETFQSRLNRFKSYKRLFSGRLLSNPKKKTFTM